MSTATPSQADLDLAAPLVEAYARGVIDRRGYWHTIQPELLGVGVRPGPETVGSRVAASAVRAVFRSAGSSSGRVAVVAERERGHDARDPGCVVPGELRVYGTWPQWWNTSGNYISSQVTSTPIQATSSASST